MEFISNYNKRSLNIELLRIVCMIMVVIGHATISSGYLNSDNLFMSNISWIVMAFVSVSVNCYFLITGYFGEQQKFKSSKIVSLWGQTIFYSSVIAITICIFNNAYSLTSKNVICMLFPMIFKQYWFIQTYVVLLLIRPVLNIILSNINFIQFCYLLSIGLLFFSIHETFIPVAYTLDSTQGYGIIWAIYMYFVGAFIHRYFLCSRLPKQLLIYFCMYFFISILVFVSNYLIVKFDVAGGVRSRGNFYAYNSLSMFAASISFFVCFILLNVKENLCVKKIILFFSKTAISVYLISAHPMLFNSIWNYSLDVVHFEREFLCFLEIFLISILVYIICSFIDFLRYIIFFKFSNFVFDRCCSKLDLVWK